MDNRINIALVGLFLLIGIFGCTLVIHADLMQIAHDIETRQ